MQKSFAFRIAMRILSLMTTSDRNFTFSKYEKGEKMFLTIRKFFTVLVLSNALILSGCASQKTWQYSSNAYSEEVQLFDKAIAVPALMDSRVNENSNMVGLYLIPLFPYGWQELNTPEGISMHLNSADWKWRPNEDIAKAVAEELDKSNIFKEAFFTNRASEGDLILQGKIGSTKYDGKIMTYGLSAYGPMLWFLGLPATSITNELSLSFQLKSESRGAIIWEKTYSETQSDLSWVYSLNPDFNYSELLKTILTKMVQDLRQDAPLIQKQVKQHMKFE